MRKNTPIVLAGLCFILALCAIAFSVKEINHKSTIITQLPEQHKDKDSKGKAKKISKYDRIDLAVQEEFEKTKDPNLGFVPRERLLQAYEYKQNLISTRAAISDVNWDERGPNNVGGRTRAILVDANDPTGKVVWAGGVSGGLWKTTNIYESSPDWLPVNDLFENLAVTSIAQDINKPDTMYFGTGEGWFNADAVRGLGIWRSIDGGTTWSQLSATNNVNFYYINKIVVDPSTGNVFASTRDGGLQKSTDAGASWTKVLGQGMTGATNRAGDVEIAANGDMYCALGVFNQDGLYKSTDGGNTWSVLGGGLPTSGYHRIEVACAPSDANRIYALYLNSSTFNTLGIYKSTDAGATWTAMANPSAYGMTNFCRNQGWYNLIAAVDPNNADKIYIGGIDVLYSSNGGTSWTQASQWYGASGYPYVHADQHEITFKPGSSDTIFFGNDGGIFMTLNGSAAAPSFESKIRNYNITQFYGGAMHPDAYSNYFLAGAQDNGSHKFTDYGISSTIEVTGGDGAFCHIDQDEPQYQFTQYVYSNFRRSSNGGSTFVNGPTNNSGRFINPTDYDNVNDKMYAAYTNGYYLRWDDPQTGFTYTPVAVTEFNGRQPSCVTVSPNTNNRVYFGTDQGRVVRVDDAHTATPTVSYINSGASMPTGYISCIAVETGNDNHILVTYSSYGVNSVWETTNGGSSWTSVEGNLPDMPVRWALFNPNNGSQALLATELGVWSTDLLQGGATVWGSSNTGLANVRVDMLKIRSSDNLVLAITHGRGLYTSDIFTTQRADFYTGSKLIYQGSSLQFMDASYKATSWSWNFGDGNSSTDQNPVHTYNTSGKFTVTLTINSGGSVMTKTNYIHVLPNKTIPYLAADGGNFETNVNDFGSTDIYGGINLWEAGSPSNYLTTLSTITNGWKTDLDANIQNADYQTALYTPNFNLTTSGSYTLSFKLSMQVAFCNAPTAVQLHYSLDKGETWFRLGNSQTVDANGTNWYNSGPSESCAVSATVIPDRTGWAGIYNNATASYNISFLAGNPNVAFRFVMYTQSGWSGGYNVDGFMVDDFEINGPPMVLPVTYSYFDAVLKDNAYTSLKWVTQTEKDNNGFEIQRSADGKSFEKIGFVKGKGTSATAAEYIFNDHNLEDGRYYYRLKQMDNNGYTSYSEIKDVFVRTMSSVNIYPNPTVDKINIKISGKSDQEKLVDVIDVSGRVIYSGNITNPSAESALSVNCSDWPKGIYFVRIKGNEDEIFKVVKY